MKIRGAFFMLAVSLMAGVSLAQDKPPRQGEQGPPPQAYEDCKGRKAGDTVEHTTPQGKVAAVCEDSPKGLVARPKQPMGSRPGEKPGHGPPMTEHKPREGGGQQYSLEQAVSDQAQLHTIAFSGLAFLTGDFGSATFIPPGKVSDFFGFQYMRDIDRAGKGHNPMFLDRIVGNVLGILTAEQRRLLQGAALEQKELVEEIAFKRFPLIEAFYQELTSKLPAGQTGLDRKAVLTYCGDIFSLDANLAFSRAKVLGQLSSSLTADQKQALARLKFGDFSSWPNVDREEVRHFLTPGAPKLENVGFMTLASEFFSWYAGSIEADTYFCPERHGTYFGGFYLKDIPAMGQKDYDISTSFTGDSGARFLDVLTAPQRSRLTEVLDRQRKPLKEIIEVRRAVSTRLRGFLEGRAPSETEILALGRRYGELDGELAFEYAAAFTFISKTLAPRQRERIQELRTLKTREEGTAFLYSDRISMPRLPDAGFLFGWKTTQKPT